jgi:hypothetical protein
LQPGATLPGESIRHLPEVGLAGLFFGIELGRLNGFVAQVLLNVGVFAESYGTGRLDKSSPGDQGRILTILALWFCLVKSCALLRLRH